MRRNPHPSSSFSLPFFVAFDYIQVFRWLEKAVGFSPPFMMVDRQGQQDAIVMSGYNCPEVVRFVFNEATIEVQKPSLPITRGRFAY